jgi:hypothetical protein
VFWSGWLETRALSTMTRVAWRLALDHLNKSGDGAG